MIETVHNLEKQIHSEGQTTKSKAKGKGKVVPVLLTEHHAMEVYTGNGSIAPRIL
jgi:hypothetical protein